MIRSMLPPQPSAAELPGEYLTEAKHDSIG